MTDGVGVADGHMEGLRPTSPAFPDLGPLNMLNHTVLAVLESPTVTQSLTRLTSLLVPFKVTRLLFLQPVPSFSGRAQAAV